MRYLAIGDIHGASTALDALLQAVQPTEADRLIFLGDYVSRGPDTRGVLDRLIQIRQISDAIFLRGNHEIMMLNSRGSKSELTNWKGVGGREALASYAPTLGRSGTIDDVPEEHWDFLNEALLAYYETEKCIFVHANLEPDVELAEQTNRMLYWEFLTGEVRHDSGKTMICGHTSQNNGDILAYQKTICIDTGAYRGGWLTCLDAEHRQFWQADVMGRIREGYVE